MVDDSGKEGMIYHTTDPMATEDIIVWDLVAESGMARLRGHVDAVTSVNFWEAKIPDSRFRVAEVG